MLEFRGPSMTKGYFRNEAKTRELFHDGWIKSGDRAYIAGGDIHITGRVKDIIIRAGRNIEPGEELTYDYHTDGEQIIQCKCRPGCKRKL